MPRLDIAVERVADVLRRAAAAAARSVHAVRVGSPVRPLDAAQARCGTRGARAHSGADAGRDVAGAAEEARGERRACRTVPGASGCRRCAPASSCSAARRDLPTAIRGPLPAARRALKPFPQLGETGAHRMLLFAGRSADPAGRRAGRPRRPAPRLRRGAHRVPQTGAIGSGGAHARAAGVSRDVPPRVSCICRTTAPPPARKPIRTAAYARSAVIVRRASGDERFQIAAADSDFRVRRCGECDRWKSER